MKSRARALPSLVKSPRAVTVLVADDCREFNQLVCAALESTPGVAVVACAERAGEAIAQAGWHRPDAVLLDFDLAGADPNLVIREIRAHVPYAALIGFSGYDTEILGPTARDMLSLHLDKRTPLGEVAMRVRELGRGVAHAATGAQF